MLPRSWRRIPGLPGAGWDEEAVHGPSLREMEALKEVFKECFIELIFLQQLPGKMMDFLASKKEHYDSITAHLRMIWTLRKRGRRSSLKLLAMR